MMSLARRTLMMWLPAVFSVATVAHAQDHIPTKVNVPELCSIDSAAIFLGLAIREIRAARVFATTQQQRFALLELEAATTDTLDKSPIPEDHKALINNIFQKEDQGWERGMRDMAEHPPKRDMILLESYRHYVDAASQELGVACHGRLFWPTLHAAATDATALGQHS